VTDRSSPVQLGLDTCGEGGRPQIIQLTSFKEHNKQKL
jgi:hypothetical protein